MMYGFILFLIVLVHQGFLLEATYPAKVLNLPDNFRLQIPKDNGSGSITTIKQPELATYSSSYFSTDADGVSVVMWSPENGVVTGNGAGPRTELSEPNDYFTFKGQHTMSFVQQVYKADPKGVVCIGQIKGDSYDGMKETLIGQNSTMEADPSVGGSSCLIVVELIYNMNNNEVTSHFRDKDCNSKSSSVGFFSPGEQIHVNFKVDNTNVYVSTNKVTLPVYSYSFWQYKNYKMHFKVGVYDQASGTDGSKGGKVKLSNLKVTHNF